jgi:hypothetical protein
MFFFSINLQCERYIMSAIQALLRTGELLLPRICDIVGMMDMETGYGPGDGFECELGEGTGSGRL